MAKINENIYSVVYVDRKGAVSKGKAFTNKRAAFGFAKKKEHESGFKSVIAYRGRIIL